MSVRLKRVSARRAAKSSGVPGVPGLGSLPEWNLADLYAGLDDPRITPIDTNMFGLFVSIGVMRGFAVGILADDALTRRLLWWIVM